MADNVTVDNGTGTDYTAATDDVGGVHFQKFKLDLGADGASVPVELYLPVGGDIAHDAADAGQPLKIGGKAVSAVPTAVASLDRVDAWFGVNGQQIVSTYTGSTGAGADGQNLSLRAAPGGTQSSVADPVALHVFNGTSWDRARGDVTNGLDVDVTRLPSLVAGSANIGDVDVLTLPGIAGDVAHDSADSGNPVKIGGKAADTAPTNVAVGDRVDAWFARNGAQWVGLTDASGNKAILIAASPGDALSQGVTLSALGYGYVFNGSLWDRVRSSGVTGMQGVGGATAADSAIAANPVTIGARASTATPTAMSADGDVVNLWANRSGAQVVTAAPHIGLNADPFSLTGKTAQYTTTQTGTALVTPTSGKKLVVTKVQIQVGGTTAGTVQLWFGASADTAYTRGTDLAIFDGEFAPSATLKPGVVMDGPWIASAVDHILRVTDSAAINPITVTVWYYEI